MTRYRERDQRFTTVGSYYNYLSTPPLQIKDVDNGNKEFCWDEIGNPEGVNPFVKVDDFRETPFLNGTLYLADQETVNKQFSNFPITHEAVPRPALAEYSILTALELNAYAWDTLAATNINSPHVSIPAIFGEGLSDLREIPALLYKKGRDLLALAGAGYVVWRFVAKPLVHDFKKMLEFTEYSNQRFKYLDSLRSGKTIKRRAALGNEEHTTLWEGPFIGHSNGTLVYLKRRYHCTSKVWGSVRYKLAEGATLPAHDIGPGGLKELAERLTLGLTSRELFATAWELVPWSWFVDKFIDVGTVIDAINNTVPLTWSHNCVMRKLKTSSEYVVTQQPASWCSPIGPPVANVVRKERYVAAPSLPFSLSLPLLDKGLWSILAALKLANS